MRQKRIGLATLALVALGAGAGAGGARGQEPRDTFRLKELVVTATRVPTPRSALPLATSVVTGQELRERGLRTVAEAVRSLPGVAVVAPGSDGGVTSLFLRGGNSGYVKVLVDGVAVNNPGGSYDFANLSTEDVERIEVVRGPGSVLYGSDAVTGVIQIFTRRGAGPLRASAGLSGGRGERVSGPGAGAAGAYGLSDWNADASGGGPRASWSLGGSRFNSGGLYPINNRYLNTTLAGRLELRPDRRSDAALTLRRTGGDFHYPTDGAGNPVDLNTATRTDAWAVGLDAGRRFGRLEARVLLGDGRADRADLDPQDTPADTSGVFASEGHTLDTRRSADAHLDWHAGGAAVVTVGATLEREQESRQSWYQSSFGDGRDSADVARSTRGFYAQAFAAPAPALSLTGGARLEDNSRFGRFTTWRAGAAWRLLPGTRLRLAAGTAFKEPTFYENFATGFVRGNPSLRPERSSSWETGLEQTLAGGRASVQATWFDQRFRDLVQYTAQPPRPDQPNYLNLGAARASGLELSAGLALGAAVRLDAGYTWLRTRVTQEGAGGDPSFAAGKRLLRRPTHSATLTAAWHAGAAASLSTTLAWTGSRDDLDFSDPNAYPAPRVVLPAHARLDLAGERRLLAARAGRPGLAATLRLENALDRKYRDIANFPARGRVVVVGARMGVGG